MTIKKLKTVKAAPQPKAEAAPTDGSVADMPAEPASPKTAATIADRFKLDAPDPAVAKGAVASKRATQIALTAGLVALAVAGILTFTLYQHWEFLKSW